MRAGDIFLVQVVEPISYHDLEGRSIPRDFNMCKEFEQINYKIAIGIVYQRYVFSDLYLNIILNQEPLCFLWAQQFLFVKVFTHQNQTNLNGKGTIFYEFKICCCFFLLKPHSMSYDTFISVPYRWRHILNGFIYFPRTVYPVW